jgi:hypothetical protein
MALAPSIALGQIGADGYIGGPPKILSQFSRQVVRGDAYVEGVGLRNLGQGAIDLTGDLPVNSVVKEAYLYWAVLRRGNEDLPNPAPRVRVNGSRVASTHVASHGEPCWSTWDEINPPYGLGHNFIDVYRNDVTTLINQGINSLSDLPSGRTDGVEPTELPRTFPLLGGASLVVIFENSDYDCNQVAVHEGAMTFAQKPLTTVDLGSFTASSGPGNPADDLAHTTFIVADGQNRDFFRNVLASFNGTELPIGGPAINDAFPGAEGANVSATDGLWDSRTDDVGSLFPLGATTAAVAAINNQNSVDCHTWLAQVTSVKTQVVAGPIGDPDDLSAACGAQPTTGHISGRGSFIQDQVEWNVKNGMKLWCQRGDNQLEINWNPDGNNNGGGGNQFLMEFTTETNCIDQPGVDEGQPPAGFDMVAGSGFGQLNGVPGAKIEFSFTDGGEPGDLADFISIRITPAGGGDPISASGSLTTGNLQAQP